MRILRAGDHRRMPWKNGGGETVEIAVFPPHATVDDFNWRVSMATVSADGPFSTFAGVDRTLSVLDGEGIVLDVEGTGPVTLTPSSAPFSFPADRATSARLLAGPITDLNVMTRRGRFGHGVARIEVDAPLELPGGNVLLFCFAGSVGLGDETVLGLHDAALVDPADGPLRIAGKGVVYAIRLERQS